MSLYTKQCSICNNQFETKRSHTLFCSTRCASKDKYEKNKLKFERACECCNKIFNSPKKYTRFCSPACINTSTKKHEDVKNTCLECNKTFMVSFVKRDRKFCSRSCATNFINKNRTEETSNKISTTQKERFENKTNIHPFLGKKLTEEHKQAISSSRIINGSSIGNKNPMYGKRGIDNPNYGIKRTKETKEKHSIIKTSQWINGKYNNVNFNSIYKRGNYFSLKLNKEIYYRSSWEKQVFEFLDKQKEVSSFIVEPFSLPYYYDNQTRRYIPDLLVAYSDGTQKLIEIKPEYLLSAIKNKAKFESAQNYCNEKGIIFEVWTEKTISNLLN